MKEGGDERAKKKMFTTQPAMCFRFELSFLLVWNGDGAIGRGDDPFQNIAEAPPPAATMCMTTRRRRCTRSQSNAFPTAASGDHIDMGGADGREGREGELG